MSTVLGAVMVLALSGTSLRAQEERADRKLLDTVLGGIGFKRDKPSIDYRERSPLVVPPSRNLPPPQTEALAAKNPAWPVDQDVKRADDLERRRKGTASREEFDDWKEGRELSPSELNRGRAASRPVTSSSDPEKGDAKPSELGFTGWTWGKFFGGNKQTETADFVEEPVRETLVQPPTGYRTPSPSQPYGLDKRNERSKPTNVYDKDDTTKNPN
jgi:hypothetical protein